MKINLTFYQAWSNIYELCYDSYGMTGNQYLLGMELEGCNWTADFAEEFKKRSGGTMICRELLGLEEKSEFKDTSPESRTKEYYQKRPCVELVQEAAAILEEYFDLEKA